MGLDSNDADENYDVTNIDNQEGAAEEFEELGHEAVKNYGETDSFGKNRPSEAILDVKSEQFEAQVN